jgi:hypothetical protein
VAVIVCTSLVIDTPPPSPGRPDRLPPPFIATQSDTSQPTPQALAHRYIVRETPEACGESAAVWEGAPQNVLVGMWRLGLVTRAHLDVVLQARDGCHVRGAKHGREKALKFFLLYLTRHVASVRSLTPDRRSRRRATTPRAAALSFAASFSSSSWPSREPPSSPSASSSPGRLRSVRLSMMVIECRSAST